MTHELLHEDAHHGPNRGDYRLVRIYRTASHRTVRIRLERRLLREKSAAVIDLLADNDAQQQLFLWECLLNVGTLSWYPGTPDLDPDTLDAQTVADALGGLATQLMNSVEKILATAGADDPPSTVIPLHLPASGVLAVYSDPTAAASAAQALDATAGDTVMAVGRPLPHNPSNEALIAMVAGIGQNTNLT